MIARDEYESMSVDELRALARSLIARLPDADARRLMDEVLSDRTTDGSAGMGRSPFR